jgi:hypothetical protein
MNQHNESIMHQVLRLPPEFREAANLGGQVDQDLFSVRQVKILHRLLGRSTTGADPVNKYFILYVRMAMQVIHLFSTW